MRILLWLPLLAGTVFISSVRVAPAQEKAESQVTFGGRLCVAPSPKATPPVFRLQGLVLCKVDLPPNSLTFEVRAIRSDFGQENKNHTLTWVNRGDNEPRGVEDLDSTLSNGGQAGQALNSVTVHTPIKAGVILDLEELHVTLPYERLALLQDGQSQFWVHLSCLMKRAQGESDFQFAAVAFPLSLEKDSARANEPASIAEPKSTEVAFPVFVKNEATLSEAKTITLGPAEG